MNIGTILVAFAAETSGLMGGLSLVKSAIGGLGGFTRGAFSDMNLGLHEITTGFQTMGTGAGGVFSSLRVGAQDVGTGLLKLGAVMAIVGGVAAAAIGVTVGVIAVRAFADFQQGMNRLVTGAGNVTDNMKTLGAGILGVSVATGTLTGGTNGLLAAMYLIDSAGQRGAQSLDTLKAAAQGAKIEQASLTAVTQILTTLQTNFGLHTYTASQYMNGLVAAVAHGKISLEDLSTAMSPILPNAKELGIHFADVAAAMADMTNQGIPADQAAQALRFTMQSMILPTHASQAAMKEWGLDTNKVAAEMKVSLPGAIQMYIDAAKRAGTEGSKPFIDALAEMMGGGQRSAKALFALSQSMGVWKADITAVNAALGQNSRDVKGWEIVQGSFNIKADQAKAALAALFITIGAQLLPVLTQIVGQITPIIQKFTDWVLRTDAIGNAVKTVTPILAALFSGIQAVLPTVISLFLQFAAVIGQATKWVAQHKEMVGALIVIMKALGIVIVAAIAIALLPMIGALALVGAAIVVVIAVVAGLIAAWKLVVVAANAVVVAWNAAIAFLVSLWHTLAAAAVIAFNAVKNAIVTAFNATIAWIVGAWNAAIGFIVGVWNTLRGAAITAFNAIRTAIMTAVNAVITWLVTAWNTCVQAVAAAFAWLYAHNTYFQQLADTIRTITQAVISWLQGAWQTCVSFISSVWSTLSGLASAAWSAATNVIQSVVQAVISWLQGAWQSAISWLSGVWNTLAGLASSIWNAITGTISSSTTSSTSFLQSAWSSAAAFLSGIWNSIKAAVVSAWNFIVAQFAAAWGRISGPLSSLGSSIKSFFTGLANQAIGWGRNIIQGIVDGINGMIGTVKSAAGNIASTITSILGFHSPPATGPAADADKWMPNMVNMLTRGLTAGVPSVAKAATSLAQPIQGSLSTSSPGTGSAPSGTNSRPLIVQIGNQEYRGFVQNLGRDLQGTIIIQKGGLR